MDWTRWEKIPQVNSSSSMIKTLAISEAFAMSPWLGNEPRRRPECQVSEEMSRRSGVAFQGDTVSKRRIRVKAAACWYSLIDTSVLGEDPSGSPGREFPHTLSLPEFSLSDQRQEPLQESFEDFSHLSIICIELDTEIASVTVLIDVAHDPRNRNGPRILGKFPTG